MRTRRVAPLAAGLLAPVLLLGACATGADDEGVTAPSLASPSAAPTTTESRSPTTPPSSPTDSPSTSRAPASAAGATPNRAVPRERRVVARNLDGEGTRRADQEQREGAETAAPLTA